MLDYARVHWIQCGIKLLHHMELILVVRFVKTYKNIFSSDLIKLTLNIYWVVGVVLDFIRFTIIEYDRTLAPTKMRCSMNCSRKFIRLIICISPLFSLFYFLPTIKHNE